MRMLSPAVRRTLPIMVAALASACSLHSGEDLAKRRDEAVIAELAQVKTLLTTPGALDSDFQVFISESIINQALRQVGAVSISIPAMADTVLTVSDAHTDFRNGYPAVKIRASVKSTKYAINAEADTSALLILDADAHSLSNSTLRVEITDLAPHVHIGFFNFTARGFWKELLAQIAQKHLDALPAFTVPLSSSIKLSAGGASSITLPTGNGSNVVGTLTLPTIAPTIGISLKNVLFLQDGVHFYLNADVHTI